jgi:flavin reductase (DIM6/NTAB) family NADH-FMN oxidoreductase RutF
VRRDVAATVQDVSIHSEHPFLEPESDRDLVRRLRGRVGGTVSLWTCGEGRSRTGLTVSSFMVANGSPARVLALVDPESDLVAALHDIEMAVVQLLRWEHRDIADAFAGVAPAPGGVFTLGTWSESAWGPVLDGAGTWAGVRVTHEPREVGWSVLLDAVVEHVEVGDDHEALVHRRGRYVRPTDRQ